MEKERYITYFKIGGDADFAGTSEEEMYRYVSPKPFNDDDIAAVVQYCNIELVDGIFERMADWASYLLSQDSRDEDEDYDYLAGEYANCFCDEYVETEELNKLHCLYEWDIGEGVKCQRVKW